MSLTPEDVERKTFKERFKGYDMDEVDAFLDRVVSRLQELQAECGELRRRAEEAERSSGESSELLQRTLVTAQRTADETVEQARAEADRLVDHARAEADWVLHEARDEAARERERLQAESEHLVRLVGELSVFRDGYVDQVRSTIQRQLDALDRVMALPDVPDETTELAVSLAAAAEAQPSEEHVADLPPEEPAGRSVLDSEAATPPDERAGD